MQRYHCTGQALQGTERKPRILVLTSTFPRWNEDAEPRFVLDLCRHLLPFADVQVLAPHAPGAACKEVIEGVQVRRFRYFIPRWQAVAYQGGIMARMKARPGSVLQLPFYLISLAWAIRRLVRDWKPNAIHAHWIIPQALAACLVVRNSPPVLCTSHGGDLFGLQSSFFQSLKAWTLKRCRAVTVVSESMVPAVRVLASDVPLSAIPMGTDLRGLFVPGGDPAIRRKDEILFVGRLVEKKGLSYLLRATAALNRTGFAVKLTVVGDGPLRNDLRDQAAALGKELPVEFLGMLRHSALPALFQRATIAAFPFVVGEDGDQEGFGLVVAEAMGCKCPVVASDLPAVRQTIEHGVTGILVPPGDHIALSEALRDYLSDSELREKYAAAALDSVREKFDWPLIASRYFRVMQTLPGVCKN